MYRSFNGTLRVTGQQTGLRPPPHCTQAPMRSAQQRGAQQRSAQQRCDERSPGGEERNRIPTSFRRHELERRTAELERRETDLHCALVRRERRLDNGARPLGQEASCGSRAIGGGAPAKVAAEPAEDARQNERGGATLRRLEQLDLGKEMARRGVELLVERGGAEDEDAGGVGDGAAIERKVDPPVGGREGAAKVLGLGDGDLGDETAGRRELRAAKLGSKAHAGLGR